MKKLRIEKARQDSEFLVLGSDAELSSPKKWTFWNMGL